MSLPSTMRVVEITAAGPPETLALAERQVPQPDADEVLIRVTAAGVNRADAMQRAGHYPPPPGASDIPGLEVAGTVAAVGPAVGEWAIGDQVCALVTGGGYAEFCVAPTPQCLRVPTAVDVIDAAALPEACFTVWTNVFDRGRLASGETLLVHGGSSGVGTAAIQLARLAGARVLATAGSPAKCGACRDLGAEHAIDYRMEDFVDRVREVTGGRGVDVILDMVGGPYLARNLDCLRTDGRLVVIGLMGGAKAEIDLARVMSGRIVVTGSTLRSRPIAAKGAIAEAVGAHVWPHVDAGRFRPVVHERFALADAAAAHRVLEASTHVGKLLLVIDEHRSAG